MVIFLCILIDGNIFVHTDCDISLPMLHVWRCQVKSAGQRVHVTHALP